MNDSNTIFEELALNPNFLKILYSIFFLALSFGAVYDIMHQSTIGIISDGIFIICFLLGLILIYKYNFGKYLILAIILYSGVYSFYLDVITSVLSKEEFVMTKVPIDLSLIIICNCGLGLFLPRLMIFINGALAILLYIFFAYMMDISYLWDYGFLVLPSLFGVTLLQGYFRRVVSRMLIKLYGEKHEKIPINLNEYGITPLEYICIKKLCEGQTTKEIAAHQKVTDAAIQARLTSVYTKLQVTDRAMLMYKLGNARLLYLD